MIAEGGHAALWLSAALALLSSASRTRLAEFAAPGAGVAALLAVCAALALGWSALAADFSLVLVDDHVHRLQPDSVRIAAVLRSPGGWLLTAAAATGLAALAVSLLGGEMRGATWTLAALLVATLVADPFARQPFVPAEGRALWLPDDLGEALAGPLLLAAALAVAAAAAGRGLPPLPRWMAIGAIGSAAVALAAGIANSAARIETSIDAAPKAAARLGGVGVILADLTPTAGPGFTAVEATLVAGGETLRPSWRTNVVSSRTTAIADHARVAGGRIEAVPDGRRLRLRWQPLG